MKYIKMTELNKDRQKIYRCQKCNMEVWALICRWINGRWLDMCEECYNHLKKEGKEE